MKKMLLAILVSAQAAVVLAGQVACVYDLGGGATELRHGGAEWLPAAKGVSLAEGDSLRTGTGAWCDLLFKDGTFVKVDENSETSLRTLKLSAEERIFSFSFLKGKALWMAAKLKGKIASKFEIHTPAAVCAVRGTDFATVVSSSGLTTVGLFDGKVELSSGAVQKDLLPGGEASASYGDIAVQARLSRLMQAEERR
jgi:hypothetical protein